MPKGTWAGQERASSKRGILHKGLKAGKERPVKKRTGGKSRAPSSSHCQAPAFFPVRLEYVLLPAVFQWQRYRDSGTAQETVPWAPGLMEPGWGAVDASWALQGTPWKRYIRFGKPRFLRCQSGQMGPSQGRVTSHHSRMGLRSYFKDTRLSLPALPSSPRSCTSRACQVTFSALPVLPLALPFGLFLLPKNSPVAKSCCGSGDLLRAGSEAWQVGQGGTKGEGVTPVLGAACDQVTWLKGQSILTTSLPGKTYYYPHIADE